MMTTIRTNSPAKLNLGLEITGRRADGYHELVSILQAITLADHMEFTAPTDLPMVHVRRRGADARDLLPHNLVAVAMNKLSSTTARPLPTSIVLDKRIPLASGLGGASSNAASTVRAINALWEIGIPQPALLELAAKLGSDVPFFLSGGTAIVRGTGDQIRPLRPLASGWFVLLSPRLRQPIERKTATLYQALTETDFSSGSAVEAQAANVTAGKPIDPALLVNPFQRHVLALRPEINGMLDAFAAAGAPFIAMSGAGPTHYTRVQDHHAAERIAERARSSIGESAEIDVAIEAPGLPKLEKWAPFT